MRKEDGTLHFFINCTDLGVAAQDIPLNVYGVVDLFGQCGQVTIVTTLPQSRDDDTVNGNYHCHYHPRCKSH